MSSVAEALLPGHLRGDGDSAAGGTAGEVLDGEAPIDAALLELKKLAAGAPSTGQ